MASGLAPKTLLRTLLVVSIGFVVHAPASAPAQSLPPRDAQAASQGQLPPVTLPTPVATTRDAIAEAAATEDVEEMRHASELNELPPIIGDGTGPADLVAGIKTLSADGSGRDVLVQIGRLLQTQPLVLPLGRDIENNRMYVWPHFAERDLATLSTAETIELVRIVGEAEAQRMIVARRYEGFTLSIGADGTWHRLGR